jgi:hypothetical protein
VEITPETRASPEDFSPLSVTAEEILLGHYYDVDEQNFLLSIRNLLYVESVSAGKHATGKSPCTTHFGELWYVTDKQLALQH